MSFGAIHSKEPLGHSSVLGEPLWTNAPFSSKQVLNEVKTCRQILLTCDDWGNNKTIVRVHYFVRGGFVGYRSRASSKHLSPHLPVGSLDSSGGSNRGCAGSEAARLGVESTKKPTPDVVVVFET
ncbi:hypothetical protein TNCV_1399311 [Trichonephila clavipes]|nr:hypothetical protein TNCV_1399311 [Trichonephila clavipes]